MHCLFQQITKNKEHTTDQHEEKSSAVSSCIAWEVVASPRVNAETLLFHLQLAGGLEEKLCVKEPPCDGFSEAWPEGCLRVSLLIRHRKAPSLIRHLKASL